MYFIRVLRWRRGWQSSNHTSLYKPVQSATCTQKFTVDFSPVTTKRRDLWSNPKWPQRHHQWRRFLLQLSSGITPCLPCFSLFSLRPCVSLLPCVQTWAQLPASTPLELSPDLLPINSSPAAFKACGVFFWIQEKDPQMSKSEGLYVIKFLWKMVPTYRIFP